MDNASFFEAKHRYKWRGEKPGPKSKLYPCFRDIILIQALTEIRDELAVLNNIDPKDLPPIQYWMKHIPRKDGELTPRAVCHFSVIPDGYNSDGDA